MKFTVHSLELHRPIVLPASGPAPDGTELLYEYRSRVDAANLEPVAEAHLADGHTTDRIEPGFYLFTQGLMPEEDSFAEQLWRKAAEAIWLESLWREMKFKNDRIRVRILSEDGKRSFQLFRETV